MKNDILNKLNQILSEGNWSIEEEKKKKKKKSTMKKKKKTMSLLEA